MGVKYPEGDSPIWPPRDWECPISMGGCGKYHSKPHFAFDGQVDYTKKPGTSGRVKFDREGSGMDCDKFKDDTPKKNKKGTGSTFDKNGNPRGLFCPHCGWEEDVISVKKEGVIFKKLKFIRIPRKCHIDGCTKKAIYTDQVGRGFCQPHKDNIVEILKT